MDIEEKESIKGEVSALDIEIAIVDGINIYVRDVLVPKGLASNDGLDCAGSEINSTKYKIALRSALACLGRVEDLNWKEDIG